MTLYLYLYLFLRFARRDDQERDDQFLDLCLYLYLRFA
jgi:hypothetical protein